MSEPGITIDVDASDLVAFRKEADEISALLKGDDLRLVMGAALKESVKGHFYALASDNAHHKTSARLGADRTGLYLKAGDNTHDPELVGEDTIKVAVDDPEHALMQRIFGGTILPTNKTLLTIPDLADSYGKLAGEFNNLRAIFFPSGSGALIEKGVKWEKFITPVYFWLVRSVTQAPDPTVAPDEEQASDDVLKAANDWLDINLDRLH